MRIYHVNRDTVETLFNAVKNHAERYCPTGGRCQLQSGEERGEE